jgi:hypothetical protein
MLLAPIGWVMVYLTRSIRLAQGWLRAVQAAQLM